MQVRLMMAFEIIFLLGGVVLAVLWATNPTGNYEPYLALVGSALALLEIRRRKLKNPISENLQSIGGWNLSPITVKEIVDTINSAPPFQKDEVSRKYNGIKVNWIGYLKEARDDFLTKGRVRVNLNIDRESIVGYSFWFTESVSRFPEVRTLKRKSRIEVVGEIVGASGSGLCVDLKPLKVTVLEHA